MYLGRHVGYVDVWGFSILLLQLSKPRDIPCDDPLLAQVQKGSPLMWGLRIWSRAVLDPWSLRMVLVLW